MSSNSTSGSLDLKFLEEWKEYTYYEKNSILKYGNKLYKTIVSHNSSSSISSDISSGKLGVIDTSASSNTGVIVGPIYVRSGNSRYPTYPGNWAVSSNPADIVWKIVVSAAGSGDYPDGGYPWTAYNYTIYFRRLGG